MKCALLLVLMLVAVPSQALELASPTGNPIYADGKYKNFRHLVLTIKGGREANESTIEIRGNTVLWRDKSAQNNLQTGSAPITQNDRLQLVQLLQKERFEDLCGSFLQRRASGLPTETLVLDDDPKLRLENVGKLAPSGYYRIKDALTVMKFSKQSKPNDSVDLQKFLPVLEGVSFHTRVEDIGFGQFKTITYRFGTNPPQSILPRFTSEVSVSYEDMAHLQKDHVVSKSISLEATDIDEMVRRINRVPWEELAGTYISGGMGPTKIEIFVGERSTSIEKLEFGPPAYMELKKYLLDLVERSLRKDAK